MNIKPGKNYWSINKQRSNQMGVRLIDNYQARGKLGPLINKDQARWELGLLITIKPEGNLVHSLTKIKPDGPFMKMKPEDYYYPY